MAKKRVLTGSEYFDANPKGLREQTARAFEFIAGFPELENDIMPKALRHAFNLHAGPRRVLDVGIATGQTWLHPHNPYLPKDLEITGIDGSQRCLNLCVEGGITDDIICMRADDPKLDWPIDRVPHNYYDLAFSGASFCYMERADLVLERMIQKTKPGGIIAFDFAVSASNQTQHFIRDNFTRRVSMYKQAPSQIVDIAHRHRLINMYTARQELLADYPIQYMIYAKP